MEVQRAAANRVGRYASGKVVMRIHVSVGVHDRVVVVVAVVMVVAMVMVV
jgi:hypothetical protein